jgi:D-3-phosphoglycerate dehydrogenase
MTERPEPKALSPLTLELLAWISRRPRTYPEAIEAWVSNCPRHPVWDDAVSDGLVNVVREGRGDEARVALTALGRATLDARPEHASTSG